MRLLVLLSIGVLTACSWHDPPTSPSTRSPDPSSGPGLGDVTSIAMGARVTGRVEPTGPHCLPNWDSTAVCRVYSLVAPEAGTVTATLTWPRGEDMDVFIFYSERDAPVWDGRSEPTLRVTAGQTIWIAAMSYKAPQDFVLETTLEP